MRIGHGYDVHRLVAGRKLILGGVEVPHSLGLLGHSDADVLLHAIMDALLGAAALGDIGHLFPDTDPAYEGISSVLLLKTVGERISGAGYAISNIDATVIAQKPKLAPYIPAMRKVVAETLGIQEGQVNLKATTEEHLGFSGREEGIAAHAVVLLREPEGLTVGKVTLEDGETVLGVVGEPALVEGMREITAWGGWRAYLKSKKEGS